MVADYKKWFASDESRRFVMENIRKSGIPLELRARRAMIENGFRVTVPRYFEPLAEELEIPIGYEQGIWRELDLCASRSEADSIRIHGCEICFHTHILGECKYSTEKDLLVFEHLDPGNADLSRFPLLVNGHKFLPVGRIAKCFRLPLVVERISEVNASRGSKEKGNFTDAITHDACEQVLSALRFFLATERDLVRKWYHDLAKPSAISVIWHTLLKDRKVEYEEFGAESIVPDQFIINFLKDNFDPEKMLRDFQYLAVNIFFPLIVIDESRGVIKVGLDESCCVTDLEDIGACLYLYVSENANRYEIVLENSFALPILICNLSQLDATLKLISEGVRCIIEEARKQVTRYPYLIPQEIIFNRTVKGFG